MTHARAASAPLHSKWHVLVYLCMYVAIGPSTHTQGGTHAHERKRQRSGVQLRFIRLDHESVS